MMPNPVQCWLSYAFLVKCNRVLFYVQLYFLAPSHLSCRTWQRAEVRNGAFLVSQCLISYWNNLISEKDDDFNTMVSAELGIEFLRTFDCGARKKKGEKGSWDPPGPEAATCSTSLLHSRVEWVGKEKKKMYVIIWIWKWILIWLSSAVLLCLTSAFICIFKLYKHEGLLSEF